MTISSSPDLALRAAGDALRLSVEQAGTGLVERAALVETVALAAVAGEHMLVIGPPGTAKSEAVRRVARAIGGVYFEYLLGRFTEPSEIFGPVDLRRLREGVVETETAGMLPEAEIAFLDEIFLGSTAILNTLLGLLNERVFRRGHTRIASPLRLCVGAANTIPEDESLAAFADRFLLRLFIDPIPDSRIEELLVGGWSIGSAAPQPPLSSVADLDALSRAVATVDLSGVRPLIADAIRMLRHAGIDLSDRRIVKLQKLVAAAAVLAGRRTAGESDLWPLIFAIPTREQQSVARETLRDLLQRTENHTLIAAAEEASSGPRARALRIGRDGAALLDARPESDDQAVIHTWQLKLEGIAREIDAAFLPETLPAELAEIRSRIAAALPSPSPAPILPAVGGEGQGEGG